MENQNKARLDESTGIIYESYIGDQQYEYAKEIAEKGFGFAKILKSQGKPTLLFVDVEKLGKVDISSLRAATEVTKQSPFDKLAVYRSSVLIKHVAEFLTGGLNLSDKVRFFEDKDEAIAWLTKK